MTFLVHRGRPWKRFATSIFDTLCLSFSTNSAIYGTNLLERHRLTSTLTTGPSAVKHAQEYSQAYIALHGTHRTEFHTTDDWEQVLDNSSFYPECTDNGHRSSSSFPFPDLQFNAPPTQSGAPKRRGISRTLFTDPSHTLSLITRSATLAVLKLPSCASL
jgi:hypothetical protein